MKTAPKSSETDLEPLVEPVRMPLPSSKELAEFIVRLEIESARIKSGEYTSFEKETFLAQLRQDYTKHLQSE